MRARSLSPAVLRGGNDQEIEIRMAQATTTPWAAEGLTLSSREEKLAHYLLSRGKTTQLERLLAKARAAKANPEPVRDDEPEEEVPRVGPHERVRKLLRSVGEAGGDEQLPAAGHAEHLALHRLVVGLDAAVLELGRRLQHVGHHLEGEHQYQDDTLQHLLLN